MITLYNEKDEKLKLISVFEFNDADMGESSISATVSFDKEQDFHPDWYVVYNGEKFYLGVRKPTGKKDTSSLSTAYTLVFKSERENLKRYTFMDFVELGTGNPQSSSYNVPLYATLSEFVDRFNLNLRHYMGSRWQMVLPADYVEDGNAVSVVFDNASLWDVLLRVHEIFGVRWTIRSAGDILQIQVGFQEVEIEHVFEYGKDNGLVSVERNNALERIITRLRGRGSERNLPADYFHTGDPDTNSFLQATYFKNLMPKAYRDYIRGYNAGSGTGSWAYNQGVSDRVSGRDISPVDYAISDKEDLWGVSYGAIEPNDQIYPTLQGATRNGVRLDEVLAVEQVLVDGVREPQNIIAVGIGAGGQESSSGKCGNSQKNGYLADCRGGIDFTILTDRFPVANPINTAQVRITLAPSYISSEGLPVPVEFGSASTVRSSAELQLVDFASSATGEIIRTQTITDTDTYLWELDNIPAGDYRFRANVTWSADIPANDREVVVNIDTRLTGATVREYARETDKGEFKETFDIEIRDVWGVARNAGETDEDYTYRVWEPRAVSEDMTVMFSDGLLAGEDYEFRIVGFNSNADDLRQTIVTAIKPTSDGGWKLTLQKSDAELEAGNIYLPNTMQNAKAGDHFFFVNISMPYDPYVYDAEERLQAYLDSQLSLKDEEYPSFTITPSKIFCSSFAEADKIQAGAKIRVRNTALVGDSYISLYIQSLTKRYSANSLNPEWSLTISDLVVASGNPVETLQGEVDVLSQRFYNNRSAIQEAVRSLSSTFLRKDGIADVSYSPTEFKKQVKLGEGISDKDFVNGDISGKGFGVYTDGDGNRVIEADVLVGRIGARFNEVVINQVTYSAGKQVFSSAGMVVSKVEDAGTSWRCYFDTKNATVRNYFALNDGAFCQRFVDSGPRQYWARVTAVGSDYIEISKTDRMQGSFDPIVGDNIAQLGNKTDKSRQAALMIDETRDGGGLVTWYDDITDFTLSAKDSVNIGRIDGKTWLQVYGSAYIGDRGQTQYVKYENGVLSIKGRLEVGTTLSDGRNLEQAINEATPEGYEEFVDSTTKDLDDIKVNIDGVETTIEDLQKQLDGAIETWFYEGVPTLSNAPASDWTTDELKNVHLGDLYYDQSTGKAYRFQMDGSAYVWQVITDTDIQAALDAANKAQDTADGKRRVFIDTPYPPYDLGDLWAGGDNMPLMRCINARESGSFFESDWALADDSHAYSDAIKAALEESIANTKNALDKSIADNKAASDKYTDDAKEALQLSLNELEKAKADIDEVYTKSQADSEISKAEQAAIDAAQEAADAAIALSEETVKAYADGIVTAEEDARIKQAQENLAAAKKYADEKAQEAFDEIATYEYLKRALGESTTVEGGLVQTSLLMLGYTSNGTFKVMSGTNGLYDSTKKGGGIAAWYGGPMADKEADSSLVSYAQSLFRFDGSGYLAGGNITWDSDGAGSVAGGDIAWDKDGAITLGIGIKISGDENETLGSILSSINRLYNWFAEDEDGNIYLKMNGDKARSFWTYGEVSSGGLSDTGGSTGGGSNVSYTQNYTGGLLLGTLSIDGITDGNGIYAPNNLSAYNNDAGFITSSAIPTALKNPYALSWSGYSSGNYDGSGTANIAIPTTLPASDVYAWAKKPSLAVADVPDLSGKYLPITGGTITNNSTHNPLTISTNALHPVGYGATELAFLWNGYQRAALGFTETHGGFIATPDIDRLSSWYYLGVKPDGTPYYCVSEAFYPLLHTGNYSSYALPLSGGTISGKTTISTSGWGNQLVINRSEGNAAASIAFSNAGNGIVGYIGIGGTASSIGTNPFYEDTSGNSYLLIHSGNIGSQSVNYANSAGKISNHTISDLAVYSASISANGSIRHIGYGYATEGWLASGPSMVFGAANGYRLFLQAYAGAHRLFVNYSNNDTTKVTGSWRELAYLDSVLSLSGGTMNGTITTDATPGVILRRANPSIPYIRFSDTANTIYGEIGVRIEGHPCFYPTIRVNNGETTASWKNIYYEGADITNAAGGIFIHRTNEINCFTRNLYLNHRGDGSDSNGTTGNVVMCALGGNVVIGNIYSAEYTTKFQVGSDAPSVVMVDSTHANECGVRYTLSGANKGWIGYYTTYGACLYNYTSKGYAGIGDDGVFRVTGNFVANGEVTSGTSASDMRLKDIVCNDYDAISIIKNLSTFIYKWNSTAKSLTDCFSKDNYEHFGLSAQEVEKVSGYLVSNFNYGEGREYLTLKKDELVPVLVQAVKQLLTRIEILEGK